MQEKRYGEFDNFEDFYADLLNDLDDSASSRPERQSVPVPAEEIHAPHREKSTMQEHIPATGTFTREKGKEERPEEKMQASEEKSSRKAAKPRKSSGKTDSTVGKAAAFFAVLMIITAVAWYLPIRPTVSVSEKRELDHFPVFSVKTLVNGQYFRGIENWFSDTFTFRENWIGLADDFSKLHGIQTVALYGDIPVADAIPVPMNASSSETAGVPESSTLVASTPAVIEDVEPTEALEVSAEEEQAWGGIVIDNDALIEDQGAKLQVGDSIFAYPSFNQYYADKYSSKMTEIADKLEGKANFYCIMAPFSVSSMLTRADREKYGFVIEEDVFAYMYGNMGENVNKVNVLENLQKHNNEYITFRSDPHWTALGAYYAYEEWCKYAGKEPVPLSEYKEYAWENFLGTFYYTAAKPKTITKNPDTVYAYEPPGDVHLYLDFTNGDKLGVEVPLLVDRSNLSGDQYITFLSTDQAKATFINNSIEDDSGVLVLKTSFGNPFVYYLTQHYHSVYVVDMRYYNYSVTKVMEKHRIDDVIVIHATDLCYSENGMNTVSRLLK